MLNISPFITFIKQHALFNTRDKVLLAVSGGRDSVLMANYFKQANLEFGIAHCNFKLRDLEADAEEQFTSNLAADLEVPFFTTFFDTQAYALEKGISIQMAARDLRYNWLEEIRADFGYHYIALGHHKSDAVETVLLNLTRGTGIAGLHGIMPKRDKLIRPLLFLSREEIDKIITQEGFDYRDDSSNRSSKYARNKIRLEVVPALKGLNPHLEETFEANARRFAELEELLNLRLEALEATIFVRKSEFDTSISLEDIRKLRPIKTLLFGLFHPYNFTENVLESLIQALDGQPGKVFDSSTHRIWLDREYLTLNAKNRHRSSEQIITETEGEFRWNDHNYRFYTAEPYEKPITVTNETIQLDLNMLRFPLKLRSWNNGDYFYPFGMKGRKKLSDYFVDQKIPRGIKDTIGVLENGNGDILWVSGYRSDERYRVSDGCEKIFILEQEASGASQKQSNGKQ